MNRKGNIGVIMGALATSGIALVFVGAFTSHDWIIYVGVVLLVAGLAGKKFMG